MNDFWELLRVGLRGGVPRISSTIDWNLMFFLSKKQAVLGLIFDAILKLPKKNYPPKNLFIKWYVLTIKIEDVNKSYDLKSSQLYHLFKSHMIPAIILKGQSIANYYSNPLHRQCGDLDIFIGQKNFSKSNNILLSLGLQKGKTMSLNHKDFYWDSIHIESHKNISIFTSPKYNKIFKNLLLKWWPNNYNEMKLSCGYIGTSPLWFNVLFLLQHIMHHILTFGIGLRHIIDWLYILKAYKVEVNNEKLIFYLKKLGLYRIAQSIVYIGVYYLGFNKNDFSISLPKSDKYANLMLDDILENGDLGKFSSAFTLKPKGFIENKLFIYRVLKRRLIKIGVLCPIESKWILWGRFKNMIYLNLFMKIQQSFSFNTYL